jgi:hypothetical protein
MNILWPLRSSTAAMPLLYVVTNNRSAGIEQLALNL